MGDSEVQSRRPANRPLLAVAAIAALAVLLALLLRGKPAPPLQKPPVVAWALELDNAEIPPSMALGKDGSAYVVNPLSGATRRVSASGKILWGKSLTEDIGYPECNLLSSPNGEVRIHWSYSDDAHSFAIIQSDGSRRKTRTLDSRKNGIMREFAVDAKGCMWAAGETESDEFRLSKSDSSGKRLWVKGFGLLKGNESTACNAIELNKSGSAFVCGYTLRSGAATGLDCRDFVGKIKPDGTLEWLAPFAVRLRATPGAVAPTSDGGTYAVGRVDRPIPYDASGGGVWQKAKCYFHNRNVSKRYQESGESDYFVARFDAHGRQMWFRQPRTSETDYAVDAATDSKGNLVIIGTESGNGSRPFVAKYDADGNLVWHTYLTGSGADACSIKIDSSGAIYVCTTVDSPENCFLVKLVEQR